MSIKKPLDPNTSFLTPALNLVYKLIRFKYFHWRFIALGQVADYVNFLRKEFGDVEICNRRESVWKLIQTGITKDKHSIVGVELGVAWGYLTWWWFKNANSAIHSWHGFDRFTGLPRSWRDHSEGAFSANGVPPQIDDSRITWHIGDIENTIDNFEVSREVNQIYVVFFDFDLYEPSQIAWLKLKSILKPGDILYFDEAYDQDERRLISEDILPSGQFRFVGCNWYSLALEVTDISN